MASATAYLEAGLIDQRFHRQKLMTAFIFHLHLERNEEVLVTASVAEFFRPFDERYQEF